MRTRPHQDVLGCEPHQQRLAVRLHQLRRTHARAKGVMQPRRVERHLRPGRLDPLRQLDRHDAASRQLPLPAVDRHRPHRRLLVSLAASLGAITHPGQRLVPGPPMTRSRRQRRWLHLLVQSPRRAGRPEVLQRIAEVVPVRCGSVEGVVIAGDLLLVALRPHAPHDVGVVEADVVRLEGEHHTVRADGVIARITGDGLVVQQPGARIQMTTTAAPTVAVFVFSCFSPAVESHWKGGRNVGPILPQ